MDRNGNCQRKKTSGMLWLCIKRNGVVAVLFFLESGFLRDYHGIW